MERDLIQFQAWDQKYKCLLRWEDIMAILSGEKRAFSDFQATTHYKIIGEYANGQKAYSSLPTSEFITQKIYEGNIFNDPDLKFLRSVGKKDKVENYLFEGDIIVLEDLVDEGYYEVVYDLKRFVFFLQRRTTKTRELFFWNIHSSQITKVGNIFENNDKFLNNWK